MRNVRVLIAYDGSRFFGWQRQAGFVSVQEAVEDGLLALCGERIVVHGSGRTDTGVHALRQVASFHLDTRLDDDRLCHALNAHLPDGVVVRALETCADDFHARFSARGKRYLYCIARTRFASPFHENRAWWVPEALDVARMRAAAAVLLGRHDFSAFESAGSPRSTSVRTLRGLRCIERREWVGLVLEADGFLYNMARSIAGTLVDAGRGKLGAPEVSAILASCDRKRAGATAPAHGLYLLRVLYPEACFLGLEGRGGRRSPRPPT
ncbi:MAG: tRNA pseudouridine(38-40) synthase TruA [Planctomycetes bacterium]|nr:tRNA pseudouridine(38-40) synthase TruA [Planctomycetota bacterium]